LELIAGAYLAACAAAGFGITYLCGIALNLEERIVFGAVVGAAAVSVATFVPSLFVRDVTSVTVLAGLTIVIVLGACATFVSRNQVLADWLDFRTHWTRSLPLAAVAAVCGAWTVHFLHQAYVYTPSGLYAGYVNIWGDWAAHLTYAGSFAYAHNFPPEFPIDPGHHLGYPFMIDFLAADLVPIGLSLTQAVTATSGMLGLAFPAVLYLAAARFLGGRAGPAIAVFVFLLSGGLGFVLLAGDLVHGGLSTFAHLPRDYTQDPDRYNLQWLNPVLAYLVPQRSTLFGLSLALIVLVILWIALREQLGWRPFLFAGLAAGTLPIFHVHAWGTVVALPAFWALFHRRREWWYFFVPALVVGLPILAWMWPPDRTAICGDWPSVAGLCFQPGWLSFTDWRHQGLWLFFPDVIAFWLWNTSLLIPLLIAGHALYRWFPTAYPFWFAPMWLWFLVPNLLVLQPWVWDNTKFFIFWALLGSILAGGVLALMFRAGIATSIVAVAVLVLLCFSGFLDLTRASDYTVSANLFTDSGGLEVADWVRHNTSPNAIFAVANQHNNPIPTLAGRRELVGYPGWLWTYGLADYQQKSQDDQKILEGDPSALDLVRQYGIDYVMIGPQEIAIGASPAYWDDHGTKVYDRDGYTIYRVGHA
jgi:hypothetical protein